MKNVIVTTLFFALILGLLGGCIKIVNTEPETQISPPTQQTMSPPIIEYFKADPPEIAFGNTTTLSWKVTNATSIEISQGIGKVPPSGEKTVMPDVRTVYTLTATNTVGSNSMTVAVNVNKNLEAKPIALTEEDVISAGFVYDSSSEPYMKEAISTYHIKFTRGIQPLHSLDNTIYVFNTKQDAEKIFTEEKSNSRQYATNFMAIGTEGYMLTIQPGGMGDILPIYSLRFYKNNVYVKLVGNILFNDMEKLAHIIESRIY